MKGKRIAKKNLNILKMYNCRVTLDKEFKTFYQTWFKKKKIFLKQSI